MSPQKPSSKEHRKTNRLSERELWGVYWLNEMELTQADIAKKLNAKRSTIQKIIQRIQDTGSPLRRTSPGKPRILDERDERHLHREKIKDPEVTYTDLASSLEDMGKEVDPATVARAVKRVDEKAKKLSKKIKH